LATQYLRESTIIDANSGIANKGIHSTNVNVIKYGASAS
jgi:hypothetical protein